MNLIESYTEIVGLVSVSVSVPVDGDVDSGSLSNSISSGGGRGGTGISMMSGDGDRGSGDIASIFSAESSIPDIIGELYGTDCTKLKLKKINSD